MRSRLVILTFLLYLSIHAPASAAVFKLDPEHSSISFKIRHLFSNVQGTFDEAEGTIDFEPGKPETAKVDAVIKAASINTRVAQRDTHLRSKDFFDVEQFPVMTFKSTGVKADGEGKAKMEGILAIHGVEKPVVFDVEIHGVGEDPWKNVRAGFTATTRINRKDFGLNWNKAVETGQLLVGEEVDITLEVEALQQ